MKRYKIYKFFAVAVSLILSTATSVSATDITGYSVLIVDKVPATGNIVAMVNNGVQILDRLPSDVYIEWYKSSNGGSTWERIPVSDEALSISVIKTGGARMEGSPVVWYKAQICNDEETPKAVVSSPYIQDKYWGMIRNGDFETPVPVGMYKAFIIDEYPEIGWNDIFNSTIEIGSSRSDQQATFSIAYRPDLGGTFKAFSNDQIIELEGESYGALYQTIITEPGTELPWSLYHCSRYYDSESTPESSDKAYVVCISESEAVSFVKEVNDDHDHLLTVIEKIIAGTSKYKSAKAWPVETPLKDVWKKHSNESDPYIVPDGQYYTRLFILGASSISGSASAGNLLDAVVSVAEKPSLDPVHCPWCALQKAINEASNGATVTLMEDCTAKNWKHFYNNSLVQADTRLLIPAGKAITIDLNGHTIDRNLANHDALDDGNVFVVSEGASLTIKDSSKGSFDPYGKGVITGGNSKIAGGAIYNNGNVTVLSGKIMGNVSHAGGAIFSEANTVTAVNGGMISENATKSFEGQEPSESVGAAMATRGKLTIGGGLISGNISEAAAGAIYIYNKGAELLMTAGTIKSNKATAGGAIRNLGKVTISGGTIADNVASGNGGGIHNSGSVEIKDSAEISGNKALNGAAIRNEASGTITLSAGTVKDNIAEFFPTSSVRQGGGAINNSGTLNVSGGAFTGNLTNGNGNGIYQAGTMAISGNPSFETDQIVYLPAGADDDHKSQYVITKVGDFSAIVPVQIANEALGRDILVSKAGASSSADGKVAGEDLSKLNILLSNKEYAVFYNMDGRDAGITPKDVIEIAAYAYIIIRRAGLNAGENAIYKVYHKAKDGDEFKLKYTVSMNVDNNKLASEDYAERKIVKAEPGIYKVEEASWSWLYNRDDTEIEPTDQKVDAGKGIGTGKIGYNQGIIFTFSGDKSDTKRKHAEAMAKNDFKKYSKIVITVDIEDWKDGGKKKIEW